MNIAESLETADKLMKLIDSRMEGIQFNNNLKSKITNGFLHLSLEHFGSIKLLIHSKMNGSAAALLRPQYESLIRGLYFYECAKEGELESFSGGREPIKLFKMVEKLESHYSIEGNSIGKFYQKLKSKMHGYTHGGIEQLEHRYTENELVGSFSSAECVQLLTLSLYLAGIAASCAAIYLGRQDLASEFVAFLNTKDAES